MLIAASVVATALILAGAYKYKYRAAEEISVVGLAEVDFTSDLIVWQGSFERKNMDIKDAYANLKRDEQSIRGYLKSKGISDTAIVFTAVSLNKEFEQHYDSKGNTFSSFSGYRLSQSVKIQSMDMNRVESVSREVTELIEKGIEFTSQEPMYFYTRLASIKMDLLAKASEDAKKGRDHRKKCWQQNR